MTPLAHSEGLCHPLRHYRRGRDGIPLVLPLPVHVSGFETRPGVGPASGLFFQGAYILGVQIKRLCVGLSWYQSLGVAADVLPC